MNAVVALAGAKQAVVGTAGGVNPISLIGISPDAAARIWRQATISAVVAPNAVTVFAHPKMAVHGQAELFVPETPAWVWDVVSP